MQRGKFSICRRNKKQRKEEKNPIFHVGKKAFHECKWKLFPLQATATMLMRSSRKNNNSKLVLCENEWMIIVKLINSNDATGSGARQTSEIDRKSEKIKMRKLLQNKPRLDFCSKLPFQSSARSESLSICSGRVTKWTVSFAPSIPLRASRALLITLNRIV
jgi:hypothetical protein